MVTFPKQFLVCGEGVNPDPDAKATIADVVAHLNYLVDQVGVEHVGIGSDFDGCQYTPEGLEHVGNMPLLVEGTKKIYICIYRILGGS